MTPHCPYCQRDLRWEESNWGFCDNCQIVLSLRKEARYSGLAVNPLDSKEKSKMKLSDFHKPSNWSIINECSNCNPNSSSLGFCKTCRKNTMKLSNNKGDL